MLKKQTHSTKAILDKKVQDAKAVLKNLSVEIKQLNTATDRLMEKILALETEMRQSHQARDLKKASTAKTIAVKRAS